jgi:hypothetical protein
MAPGAMQVAAFEKNYHANTGAIVNGISFYIENQALGHVCRFVGSANI